MKRCQSDHGFSKPHGNSSSTSVRIGRMSLRFRDDPLLEARWQTKNLARTKRICQRFFAAAIIFQILFSFSDFLEGLLGMDSAYLRLAASMEAFLAVAAIGSGVIVPGQPFIALCTIVYGVLALAAHQNARSGLVQWDSLYITYGLSFSVLPKVSPLGFLHSLFVCVVLCTSFLGFASVTMNLSEFFLSAMFLLLLLPPLLLMSYSSERDHRERWLLKERLRRECIALKLISVKEDLGYLHHYDDLEGMGSFLPQFLLHLRPSLRSVHQSRSLPSRKTAAPHDNRTMILRGLAAWLVVSLLGWWSSAGPSLPRVLNFDIDPEVSWALASHSIGFSVFLLLVTRKLRWVVLNVACSLLLLFLMQYTFPRHWLFGIAHSFGYLLLATLVLSLLGVFGGIVWLWTELVDLLKSLVLQYPQIYRDEIRSHPVLENIILRGQQIPDVLSFDHEAIISPSHRSVMIPRVLGGTRGKCMFCLRGDVKHYLPACEQWGGRGDSKDIPMCTPYTGAILAREESREKVLDCQRQLAEALSARKQAEDAQLAAEQAAMTAKAAAEVYRLTLLGQQDKRRYKEEEEVRIRQECVDSVVHELNDLARQLKAEQKALRAEVAHRKELEVQLAILQSAREEAVEMIQANTQTAQEEILVPVQGGAAEATEKNMPGSEKEVEREFAVAACPSCASRNRLPYTTMLELRAAVEDSEPVSSATIHKLASSSKDACL